MNCRQGFSVYPLALQTLARGYFLMCQHVTYIFKCYTYILPPRVCATRNVKSLKQFGHLKYILITLGAFKELVDLFRIGVFFLRLLEVGTPTLAR
eukprot:XP_001708175.1 Hypothetical protein GL50803_32219 [Giardia lamblia ATCC 50803]